MLPLTKNTSPDNTNMETTTVTQKCGDELLFYRSTKTSCTFVYGPVSLQEVRLEENFKEAPRQALDGVFDGEDVDLFSILDVRAGVDAAMLHTLPTQKDAGF